MFKTHFHMIIYKYEAILIIFILFLTGSVAVSSRDADIIRPDSARYPYKIALTFDDGPHPVYTNKLLKVLRDENVRATFFVVGSQAVKYPYLLKSISALGNEVESHTFTHRNLKKISKSDVIGELLTTKGIIKDVTGQDSVYFRPPGGQYNKKVELIASKLGLKMVLWSVFPKDHQEKDKNAIINKVLNQSADGGIIILHSGIIPTLNALPEIIRELKKRGYRFVTIKELHSLHNDGLYIL